MTYLEKQINVNNIAIIDESTGDRIQANREKPMQREKINNKPPGAARKEIRLDEEDKLSDNIDDSVPLMNKSSI